MCMCSRNIVARRSILSFLKTNDGGDDEEEAPTERGVSVVRLFSLPFCRFDSTIFVCVSLFLCACAVLFVDSWSTLPLIRDPFHFSLGVCGRRLLAVYGYLFPRAFLSRRRNK